MIFEKIYTQSPAPATHRRSRRRRRRRRGTPTKAALVSRLMILALVSGMLTAWLQSVFRSTPAGHPLALDSRFAPTVALLVCAMFFVLTFIRLIVPDRSWRNGVACMLRFVRRASSPAVIPPPAFLPTRWFDSFANDRMRRTVNRVGRLFELAPVVGTLGMLIHSTAAGVPSATSNASALITMRPVVRGFMAVTLLLAYPVGRWLVALGSDRAAPATNNHLS